MGGAMARALVREGRSLVLYNRTRDRAEALAADLGDGVATVAASPAEVAATADVTLTILADDAALDAVFDGPDGLVAGAGPGRILVNLSTVMPGTVRALEPRVRATGAGLLDSPVSGSTATAESGTLTLIAGGTADDLERARPALEPLARTIVHVGPVGAAASIKLAVNTVIFGLNQALAEAVVLAERAGIDRATAYDVIANSAVGAPFVGYKRSAFLDPEGTPPVFGLDLAIKDLTLIADLAASVGVTLPQAAVNLAVIRDAAAGGREGRDFSRVADRLRELADDARTGATPGEAKPG
jgi:3-hydroxyisobutyrate dehydrogenase/2-hydroxy-3-oxopropionate reductase